MWVGGCELCGETRPWAVEVEAAHAWQALGRPGLAPVMGSVLRAWSCGVEPWGGPPAPEPHLLHLSLCT